jgi:hypothetical protein
VGEQKSSAVLLDEAVNTMHSRSGCAASPRSSSRRRLRVMTFCDIAGTQNDCSVAVVDSGIALLHRGVLISLADSTSLVRYAYYSTEHT